VGVAAVSGEVLVLFNRGSLGSTFMARYPNAVEAIAKNPKTRVHGIEAAIGKRGDTNTQNSTTKSGKKIQVDTCVDVYGGARPFTRLGRTADIVFTLKLFRTEFVQVGKIPPR
jgi:hypothetical protein